MKRLSMLALLLVLLLFGCSSEKNTLSEGQEEAVESSIAFINESSFDSKNQIDFDIVKIENVTDTTWKAAWVDGKQISQDAIDSTDWIITVGDTSYHDYAVILCDSVTGEVIGYIPIE